MTPPHEPHSNISKKGVKVSHWPGPLAQKMGPKWAAELKNGVKVSHWTAKYGIKVSHWGQYGIIWGQSVPASYHPRHRILDLKLCHFGLAALWSLFETLNDMPTTVSVYDWDLTLLIMRWMASSVHYRLNLFHCHWSRRQLCTIPAQILTEPRSQLI